MAAVREQHEPAAGRTDPLEHLDRARLRVARVRRATVHERAVDVEHEPANVIEAQAVTHDARAPSRRP